MQSLYIITGNFIYLFAQWALTIVAVRSGNYYVAGILGLSTTIANIFYIIASYGLRAYQISDVNKQYSDQCYVLSRVVTICVAFVSCVVYVLYLGYDSSTILAVLLYMVYKCFEAASDVLYGVFQINDRYDYVCISMGIKGVLSLIVFTAPLVMGQPLELSLLAMVAVAALTFFTFDLRWCLKYVRPLILWTRDAWQRTLKLLWVSAPMVVLLIAQPLLMSIPRLFFEQHYSTELLGAYSTVSSPTVVISTFVSCAMMPYVPLFAQYFYAEEKRRLYKLTFGSLFFAAGFGLCALIGGALLGEWALVILYGESIRGYAPIFLLVIIVTTFSALTMCLNALFIAMRKLTVLSCILLLGCLLCQLITPYFVSTYAMAGITYALMFAQAFQLLLGIALAVWYISKIPTNAKKPM